MFACESALVLASARYYNDHECARLRSCPGARFGFLKFSCRQADRMCCRIDPHGPRARWGFDGLDDLEFPRSLLARHCQRAVGATREPLVPIQLCSINTLPNRKVRNDVSIISAHNNKILRLAA